MQTRAITTHETLSVVPATDKAVKLSVNVSSDVGQRLRSVAYEERLSESSIVQIALMLMFNETTAETVGEFLREHGASLRRG